MLRMIFVGVAGFTLVGCTTLDSSPLLFGQGLTVGISVGPSPTANAVPEIVIGVKQADIAVVPTVIPKEVPIDGTEPKTRRIAAFDDEKEGETGAEDALSTFGSFTTDTEVNNVKLGIFFATGVAAQNLAEGFGCAVSEGKAEICVPKAEKKSDANPESPAS